MRINLAVIFGSRTCEHDVSIISGLQAVGAATANFQVTPVYISRDGEWYVGDKLRDVAFYQNFDAAKVTRVLPIGEAGKLVLLRHPGSQKMLWGGLKREAVIDVAMPVMHGMNGEDGTLQGMLELWNVPYTSSGMLGSAVGMDKIAMKQLFRGCGFPVLPDTWIDRAEWVGDRNAAIAKIEAALEYPMYVKPANLGSSIGISRADDRAGLIRAVDIAASYDRRILIERGVTQIQEVNCSVLGYGGEARASVIEMPLRWDDAELLDFDKKYLSGKAGKGMESLSRRIPAPIGDALTGEIQDLSVQVFRALDSKGVVRIDYIIDQSDHSYYIGEINTIPGSLSFYLWEPAGVKFPQLVDTMVEYALRAHAEKNQSVFSYDSSILKSFGQGAKRGAK